MTVGYAEIARVLRGARGRLVRILAGSAALRALAQAVACLLGGALGVAAGARIGFARPVTLLGMAAAFALEGWRYARALRAARDPEVVARALGGSDGPLRSALVSAVELERDRGEIEASGRFSLALLDGHVDRSARALASVDVVRAIPSLPVRRAAIGLGAVVAVMLLTVAIAPARVGGGLRRILAGDPAASRLALDPITGDVELTFRYPAYMRRAPKTLSGTGGEIRAPKGTEVALKTRADRPVKGAEVEVEVASRERGSSRKVPLTVTAERQLAGRFTVEGAGAYRFRFLDGRGRAVAEGPPIPIVVEPDAFPEVRITSPAQEVEVQPGATVKVEWLASDDVGLRDLTLVLKVGGGPEKRKVLRQLDGARRDGGGFDLELKPLGLGEGERLLYWLEATDGDAVSGPKKGASATQAVKIYSEAEHRRKLMEAARAAWEELVGVTGDHLELGARKLPAAQQLPLAEPLDGRVRR
ncbi:MAG: hypothetical protein WCC48_17790, partial [Anaeromyxobacteraceae bacterium]